MRRFMAWAFLVLLVFGAAVWASPVSPQMATEAAYFSLYEEPMPDFERGQHAVTTASELREEPSMRLLGYVFELSPTGFIVVPSETRIVPVVSYSGTTEFSWEESDLNALLEILIEDLGNRLDAVDLGLDPEARSNEERWQRIDEVYSGNGSGAEYAYASSMAQAAGTQYGPLMTFPTWNQTAPWNNGCPNDPVHGGRSVTGCTATALAQVLNYWRAPASVTFQAGDDYSTKTHSILVNAPGGSIGAITYGASPSTNPSSATMAALSYAAGISVRMDYCSKGSRASLHDAAIVLAGTASSPPGWNSGVRAGLWGYQSANVRTFQTKYSLGAPYYVSQATFYANLQSNMRSSQPAILSIWGTDAQGITIGHAVVCHGWRANSGVNYYFLNMGWGGTSDNWYALPTVPAGGGMNFNVLDCGVLDIRPGSPVALTARFTHSVSGNTVNFDASGSSPSGAITSYSWSFGDGSTGSGMKPSHTYSGSGPYTVALTVRGSSGSNSTSAQVHLAPPVSLTASFTYSISGNSVSFDASGSSPSGSITSYAWDFGDGSSGTGVRPTHVYAAGRTYQAHLTVFGSGGQSASTSSSIYIPPAQTFADLTATIVSHRTVGPRTDKRVQIEVRIENSGTVAAGSFYVLFSGGADPASEQRISGLAAGGSTVLTVSRSIDSSVIPYQYTIQVVVDSHNEVNESNEGNNTAVLSSP